MRENNLEIKDYIDKSHLNSKVGKKLNSKYKKVFDQIKNELNTPNQFFYLFNKNYKLSTKISDLEKELNKAKAKPHIEVVRRDLSLKHSSDTKGGRKAYPLVIWTAMMEMLTLGAPPSSIPGSIVSVVHNFLHRPNLMKYQK